jgi:hypothetical protein
MRYERGKLAHDPKLFGFLQEDWIPSSHCYFRTRFELAFFTSVRYWKFPGVPMNASKLRDEFLAKAKEAEERAEKTTDEQTKASWLRIAAGYHDLAARHEQT